MLLKRLMISPHSLNLCLKRIKNIIVLHEDCARAAVICNEYSQREFDSTYFNDLEAQFCQSQFEFATLLLYLDCPNEALTKLAEVRIVLDKIFTKNLWLAERLLQDDTSIESIGTLDMLPWPARFIIRQELFLGL